MSDVIETLLHRNEAYALQHEPRAALPTMNTIVLSCLDARIDPAHILGVEPGEALVIRNAGGRVTQAVEQEIAMILAMVSAAIGKPARPHIVLVQHTHCGMENFADPELAASISQACGVPMAAIESRVVHDHDDTLRADLERLRGSAYLPGGLTVSGLRYDETTGCASAVFTDATT